MHYKKLIKYLRDLYLFAFVLLILVTVLGSRLFLILNNPELSNYIMIYKYIVLVWSFIILRQQQYIYLIALFCLILLFESYSRFFEPSLAFGVPWQDYLFVGGVSANFSFHVAISYLKNMLLYIFPILALVDLYPVGSRKKLTQYLCFILCGIFINICVTFIQGFYDLNFLSIGTGLALKSHRAVGLLEDSAANGLFFGILSSGVFSLLILSTHSWKKKISLSIFLALLIVGGFLTKGRIFFAIFAVGILVSLIFYIFCSSNKLQRKYRLISGTIFLIFFSIIFIQFTPSRMWRVFNIDRYKKLYNATSTFDKILVAYDPDRSVHIRVMIKAFLDAPVLGNGLGSFYQILHRYKDWAMNTGGGRFFADPPGNFYLMLACELGLLGLFLSVWLIGSYVFFLKKYEEKYLNNFFVGFGAAILTSFLAGIHIIFSSFSLFFAIFLVFLFRNSSKNLFLNKISLRIVGVFCLIFLGAVLFRFVCPKSPILFDSEFSHKPQVPLTLNIPIVTPYDGNWFPDDAIFLIDKNIVEFFVEMPREFYPLKVSWKLFNQNNELLSINEANINEYNTVIPGQKFVYEMENDIHEKCFKLINKDHFCYMKIFTNANWVYNRSRVGVFVNRKNLTYDAVRF